MRPSSATTATAVLLLTYLLSPVCLALTIVSPFTGSTVDPSQPLTIIWTSSSADPTTITFKLESSNPSTTLASTQVLASNVPSRQGSVTVPAYTIEAYGSGYEIVALGPNGQQVAVSGSLVLAESSNSVTTLSGGALSFVSSDSTKSTTKSTAKESAMMTTTMMTTTTTSSATEQSFTMFTGTATAITGSTTGALSVPTQSTQPTGFVTSSTTRTGSASAATSSAAANTNTANRLGVTGLAFPGMGRGEVVMGAAGVLAGVVALIV